ncbi:integrase [Pseudomonas sp. o96-267]|nr:integrase [Pseudomonas sp. o96-267]
MGEIRHHSVDELGKLIDETNGISVTNPRGPALTILGRMKKSRKSP